MNVLQMYWLRYGGHAAFQTKDVAKVLVSSGRPSALDLSVTLRVWDYVCFA
jgi:hypothetical protein